MDTKPALADAAVARSLQGSYFVKWLGKCNAQQLCHKPASWNSSAASIHGTNLWLCLERLASKQCVRINCRNLVSIQVMAAVKVATVLFLISCGVTSDAFVATDSNSLKSEKNACLRKAPEGDCTSSHGAIGGWDVSKVIDMSHCECNVLPSSCRNSYIDNSATVGW